MGGHGSLQEFGELEHRRRPQPAPRAHHDERPLGGGDEFSRGSKGGRIGFGAGIGANGATGATSDCMPNTFHGVSTATGRTRPLRS